jgi:hypothetical protein
MASGLLPTAGAQYGEASGLIPISVLRPGMMLEFERWRVEKAGTVPVTYRFLQGATNASDWQNCDPETWLCTGVSPSGIVEVDKDGKLLATAPTIYRERIAFQYQGFAKTVGGLRNNWTASSITPITEPARARRTSTLSRMGIPSRKKEMAGAK